MPSPITARSRNAFRRILVAPGFFGAALRGGDGAGLAAPFFSPMLGSPAICVLLCVLIIHLRRWISTRPASRFVSPRGRQCAERQAKGDPVEPAEQQADPNEQADHPQA